MEKIKESIMFNKYHLKYYKMDDNINVFDVINQMTENGINIDKIEIGEGVESDMQTLDGSVFTVDEFNKNYAYICNHISNGSYTLYTHLDDKPLNVFISCTKPIIILTSLDEKLELDDLLTQKKSKEHGHAL